MSIIPIIDYITKSHGGSMNRQRSRIEVEEDLKRVNEEIQDVTSIRDNLNAFHLGKSEWDHETRLANEDLQKLDEKRSKLERELSLLPPDDYIPDEGAALT